jgi:exonuclease SbcC
MIPLQLCLSGFLSYRDPVELDFTTFELACISGPNGAGKSSLLDAITWALFGVARKRDESLINSHPEVKAAEVVFVFAYEDNIYRVQRTLPRGKTQMLEFQILQRDSNAESGDSAATPHSLFSTLGNWKPLTEHTLRATQERIVQTLRLDYDTFINASFFLQGKADQFTQQPPGSRKSILSSILGLEVWEDYRRRAADQRKALEGDIAGLDGRLAEINAELGEEEARKERLQQLDRDLSRLAQARETQESALKQIRLVAAMFAERRKNLDLSARQLDEARARLAELEARLAERQAECQGYAETLGRAAEIETAYKAWQQARADVEYWDQIAVDFREHEKLRQPPLDEINAERARLQHEQQSLLAQQAAVRSQQAELEGLHTRLEAARQGLARASEALAERAALDAELQVARMQQAEANAENPRLRKEMDELKARIDQLSAAEGAACPVCGQPLSEYDRQALVEELNAQGREMGDRYRANSALVKEAEQVVRDLEARIASLARSEEEYRLHTQESAQLTARQEQIEAQVSSWEQEGAPRLEAVTLALEKEDFAGEARQRLAAIDVELKSIGYDAAAHDAARRLESYGRAAETELRALEKAQAAIQPLEREIAGLEKEHKKSAKELARQQAEYDQAAATLAADLAQAPDLRAAEAELLDLQEQENRLRLEVGAARQKVLVLDDLKSRRKALEAQRQDQARLVGYYKQLERAFGKDGVPALLIEQALPQIEAKANEILDRLSAGNMSVRFITQAAYKDKRRDDRRETLDILISDGAGTRDYEMFSGGEAFRVNFAIRLALSEVLAQRAGARLQTLVIDEGFGSQDAQGRQRLIEAINLVRHDFAKILVITHIDELKDAFPNRIDVEKTANGSVVSLA